jgi:hypothetical protein
MSSVFIMIVIIAVIVSILLWFVIKSLLKPKPQLPDVPKPITPTPKSPVDEITDFIQGKSKNRKQEGRDAAMVNHEETHKIQIIVTIKEEGRLLCDLKISEINSKILKINMAIDDYTKKGMITDAQEKTVEKQRCESDIEYIKNQKKELETNTNLPLYLSFIEGFDESRNAKMKEIWG